MLLVLSGPAYYQQQADYKIDIELDDKMLN
jgi:hypothetical protein